MATHSSILAWKILEPGGLWSIESQRVGHDQNDLYRLTSHVQASYIPINRRMDKNNVIYTH